MTITTFTITQDVEDNRINFTIDEMDFAEGNISWCSVEVFHPTRDELVELYYTLHKFLFSNNIEEKHTYA